MHFLSRRRLRISPWGESLSFAAPKESNQRKGDPTSLPFGFPIWRARTGAPPTRPGTGHKTPRAAELRHGSALFPPARTKSAALKGNTPEYRSRVMPTLRQAPASAGVPLGCRREAQPCGEKRGGVSERRSESCFMRLARASSLTAPRGEHRRGAEGRRTRGGLFFGYARKHALACFRIEVAATQKKVTRLQVKREAPAHPHNTTKKS